MPLTLSATSDILVKKNTTKFRNRLIFSFMLVALFVSGANNAVFAKNMAYCTAASTKGGQYWTWTKKTVPTACYTAFTKLLDSRNSVNNYWKGTYSTTKLNQGTLKCKQGSKKVYGQGASVFENGLNMKNQLGWSGCYMKKVK